MFSIQGYSYSSDALNRLSKGEPLNLDVDDYVPLTLYQYVRMKKSLSLYAQLLKAQSIAGGPEGISLVHHAKAAAKLSAGQRWITVHPNGKGEKGVPVLIQEDGGGTAHIVGGAGGRLNMLKLNNVKSKEEYAQLSRERRQAEATARAEARRQKEMSEAGLTSAERTALREQDKARRDAEKTAEEESKEKISAAKKELLGSVSKMLGWEDKSDQIYDGWQEARKEAVADLKNAIEEDDKPRIKAARKALKVVDKGYEAAMKTYESNMMAAAKSAVKDIQHEAIADEEIRTALEERIGSKTGAEEVIQTEKKGASKGFVTGYGDTAEEMGLTAPQLAEEKEKLFQENLQRIAEEIDPRIAMMIEKGVQTRRAIGEVRRELYEREKLEDKVTDIDQKAETIKQYLAFKKVLESEGKKKDVKALQQTIDGEMVDDTEEKNNSLSYGDGMILDDEVSLADFTRDLEKEAAAMETERAAAVNASLLEKIKANPNGAEKWIANGHYDGFNRLSLTVLKSDALSRDVSDVLGLRTSAQLLSKIMRESMSAEEFADAAEAIQRFHADTSEEAVRQAVETADQLFDRAEKTLADINALKADNPDDLAMLKSLNKTRIDLLDEANRVLGQTLGSLESAAMLGSVMKQSVGRMESAETNLGAVSSEEAVVRLRAIGLGEGDYKIESVNGDRIATINASGLSKLARAVDPEEIALDRDVEDIKRGVYDESGWMPAGLVDRPADSFEDPGINPDIPAGEVDNQSLGDDAESVKSAQEAAHRALGALPEGSFAFKKADDLTAAEQTDLRRYWENHIYQGSTAERQSVREYQGEKGVTRSGAWQSFASASGGEAGAYESIKADLIKNHSSADGNLFGEAEPPAITKVNPADINSYRGCVDGATELFEDIDGLQSDIEAGRITESRDVAEKELNKKKAELPGKLEALYKEQLRDHYHKWMSGYSEEEYAAGDAAPRHEGSPWAEYVRMHGDVKRAQEAVLDTLKGKYVEKFADQYARVAKKPLGTRREKIAGHQAHMLGMLGKEERDSVINKVQSELSSAGATVANRSGGKFASGSWREKAIEYLQKQKNDAAAQGSFFGEEELKQDDGTERVSIGKRAEEQLASFLPELSQNQLRGQKFAVNTMIAKGERQRAIKMLERAKRMNLTFGTGKGKTIISIASFTDLHAQGKAKRAIFAVPSVVQSQFGNEVNVFCEPGKYKVASDPSLDRAGRIAAMKDGSNHMVVMTHQSIRDDMVYLMAQRMGVDDEAAKIRFNGMAPKERAAYLGETMKENGIDFSMLTVDEAHYSVNRKGKDDSTLSNVLDALNANTEYFMNQTATPVKNDSSEAFDMLHKIAPDKFKDRDEFLKRYGVDSEFSRESLRRLIGRYNYASPTETGVKKTRTKESVQLSPAQKQAYEDVEAAFRRASRANKANQVDVEAMKMLSPNSFKDKPEDQHEDIARRLQSAAGTIKEEALNRVVNTFDPANNAKIQKLMDIVESKRYDSDHARNKAKKGDRAPGVIFAHNLASVDALKNTLAAKGLRVGVIHGAMTGAEKEKVKVGFNPPNPGERKYDVVVLSDAGATGLNLQNAKYLVNYDLPHTSWVKEQREGRIDRMGQAHDSIDYHDIVTDTEHEATKWDRVQRKARLGAIFQQDPGAMDDTGLAGYLAAVRQERFNSGEDNRSAA